MIPAAYRGRFAPSPTGPLHMGSLIAAVASYLQARAAGGDWLLRIDDIDPPREAAGARESIIRSLEAHGFDWCAPVRYQSRNRERHDQIIDTLRAAGRAYPCTCSRQSLSSSPRHGTLGPIYPGTCRHRAGTTPDGPFAIRALTDDAPQTFDDALQGRITVCLEREVGDFLIRRKDELIAYALAVAIDDADDHITEVVRGCDLLDFTAAELYLRQQLDLPSPSYMHVPVAIDAQGRKLSKQTGAAGLDDGQAAKNLYGCLQFLGQQPPVELQTDTIDAVWDWALAHWRPAAVAGCRAHPAPAVK